MRRRDVRRGSYLLASGALALLAFETGCPSSSSTRPERACSGAEALSVQPIAGSSLGNKQLALTFDDGPGARTSELSTFLKNHGIRATFFMNGKCLLAGNPCGNPLPAATILAQIVADGHLVANHTQDHLNLVSPRPAASVVIQEVSDTDALIGPYVDSGRFLFRAPYGAWDQTVYDVLSNSTMSKYVGTIDWDIGSQLLPGVQAADWDCWDHGYTTRQCGDLYMNEITNVTKGIVLMHDSHPIGETSNDDIDNGKGNSVVMVEYLVPLLQAAGYTFKRADEVPAIAALLPPMPPKDAGSDAAKPRDAGTDASGSGSDASAGDAGTGPGPTTPGEVVDAGSAEAGTESQNVTPAGPGGSAAAPDPCAR